MAVRGFAGQNRGVSVLLRVRNRETQRKDVFPKISPGR